MKKELLLSLLAFRSFQSIAWAICPVFGSDVTFLQWSKDGNAALLYGNFFNGREFIVVDGVPGNVSEFPFHAVKPGQDPSKERNGLSLKECSDQMTGLSTLLKKREFSVAQAPNEICKTRGPLSEITTKERLDSISGVTWPLFEQLNRTAGPGQSSNKVSPGGLLKFQVSQSPFCGDGRVQMFARGREIHLADDHFLTDFPVNAGNGVSPPKDVRDWLACRENKDCVVIDRGCFAWAAVNKEYSGEFLGKYSIPVKKCVAYPHPPAPRVSCAKKKCTLTK